MSRGVVEKSLSETWFAPNYQKASNIYGATADLPIASPIFSISKGYNYGLGGDEELEFRRKFPLMQRIRGDGACYFNACMAGILNKCVNDPERWNLLRRNLIERGCQDIADRIGDEGAVLTRQKVNQLLQERGDENMVRQITEQLLVPLNQDFVRVLQLKIEEQQKLLADSDRGNGAAIAIDAYKDRIKNYDVDGRASVYYESDVEPIIAELFPDLEIVALSREQVLVADEWDLNLEDPNAVYLWNPGGGAHFDLLYSAKDEINSEIPRAASAREVSSEIDSGLADLKEKMKRYQGAEDDFSKLVQQMYAVILSCDERSRKDLQLKEIQGLLEIIADSELSSTPEKDGVEADKSNPDNAAVKAIQEGTIGDSFEGDARAYIDENEDGEKRPLIVFAALLGRSDFIPRLHEFGEDFAKKDLHFGNTALIWAIANANNKFAYELLRFAEEEKIHLAIDHISEHGNTALHLAAAKGYDDKDSDGKDVGVSNRGLVQKLISAGADPNIFSNNGNTALDIAVARRDVEMIGAICQSPIVDLETIRRAQEVLQYGRAESEKIVKEVTSPLQDLVEEKEFAEKKDEVSEILENAKSRLEKDVELYKSPAKAFEAEGQDKSFSKKREEPAKGSPGASRKNIAQRNAKTSIKVAAPSTSPEAGKKGFTVEAFVTHAVLTTKSGAWAKTKRQNNYRTLDGVYGIGLSKDGREREERDTMRDILLSLTSDEEITKRNGGKNLSLSDLLKIVDLAKDKGGVSHKKIAGKESYEDQGRDEVKEIDAGLARTFSALYQQKCESCGIYSGRAGVGVKGAAPGSRLTFVPDEVVKTIRKNSANEVSDDEMSQVKKNLSAKESLVLEVLKKSKATNNKSGRS
ncbi:MAG: ankyrin repeat domain-containing protein [Rickettsiales bacterium]|nr:ankyrin repeat domain-containing protein [Rickettsiales bacterium]